MQPKSIILFFYGYILFFRRQNLYITNLKAYKEKEQQNTTDKIPYNETIFIRAYLNNEEKFFFDETIKWAYCIKKKRN